MASGERAGWWPAVIAAVVIALGFSLGLNARSVFIGMILCDVIVFGLLLLRRDASSAEEGRSSMRPSLAELLHV